MSVLPSPRIDVPHVPTLRHFTPEMEATLLKSAAWHSLVLVFSLPDEQAEESAQLFEVVKPFFDFQLVLIVLQKVFRFVGVVILV